MVNSKKNTESRILEAAKTVFHQRGFEGARMQEIADTAGINKSLLHYYFRTKENLFQAVFREAVSSMAFTASKILFADNPLEEKLASFFDYHFHFLQENSFVPWFIINGLYEKPEQMASLMKENNIVPEVFLRNIRKKLHQEGLGETDPLQLYMNIVSLSVFPFIARPMLQYLFGMNEKELDRFYTRRMKMLPAFIMNAITPKKVRP